MTLLTVHVADNAEALHGCQALFDENTRLPRKTHIIPSRDTHVVYIKAEGKVTAACRFTYVPTLAWGNILQIDAFAVADASIRDAMSLLHYLKKRTPAPACSGVHLQNTSVDEYPERIRRTFDVICHHMSLLRAG